MKKIILTLLCALMSDMSANAQTSSYDGNRQISVSGEAEIRVVPDQVLISLTVENRGGELVSTKRKNDKIVKSILNYATTTIGLDKKHIQTDFVNVTPEFESCSHRDRLSGACDPLKVIFYTTKKGIQVRLMDLEAYEDFITKALELGATHIDNVQFVSTELRKHRDEARELAAKAAQEKAQAIAKTLDMEVLKPISVNLNNTNWHWGGHHGRGYNSMTQNVVQSAPTGSGMAGGGNLSVGQINISATVNVTFEMK